jgi:hypothetical protein
VRNSLREIAGVGVVTAVGVQVAGTDVAVAVQVGGAGVAVDRVSGVGEGRDVGATAVSTTRVTAIGSLAGRQASNIISKTLKRKKYRFIENLPFET